MKNSFKLIHELNCVINHHGSSGSKEVDGLIECFQGPEKDRKLRYIDYLGNGDSKSFLEISKLDIYPQKQVKKLECVGWCYSKAIGQQVEKTNEEILGGKGRLTDKMINKLHNYFDIATVCRQNQV